MAHILLVDDDIVNSRLLLNKLTANGHTVEHASDGAEAREKEAQKYDLILLDIMMPVVDGITLLSEFKTKANKHTSIIMFTNLFVKETTDRCISLGATEVLLKADFTPQRIVEKIETYVKKVAS
jgi:CheY-like chemotaxis protein